MRLSSDQKQATKNALHALENEGRALVVKATGLGKTLVMRTVSQSYKGRILFLCHDADILEQNEESFAEVYNQDKETGLYYGDDESGFNSRIMFATFQKMANVLEKFGRDASSLVMVDECHHAPAETFRPVIEYFECPRLGVTATRERMDGLSIEEIFGNPVFLLELPEAVRRGLLMPFKYHLLSDHIDSEVIESLTDERTDVEYALGDLNRRLFIARRDETIAKRVIDMVGKRKTIVFCPSIGHAIYMASLFGSQAKSVHSAIGRNENRERIQAFREGKFQYLVVVNKANEGVDIPDAEAAVFLRSTQSKIVITQQLGRVLRKLKQKGVVQVLDFVNSFDRIYAVRDLMLSLVRHGNNSIRSDVRLLPSVLHVSGQGFEFHFDQTTRDLMDVIERMSVPSFYSFAKAKTLIRSLGITTSAEYRARYRAIGNLPANPSVVYRPDWIDWYDFCETTKPEFYTYSQAKVAARKLKVSTQRMYKEKRSLDPQLPAHPDVFYKDEWLNWASFLEKEVTTNYTYLKAQKAVREMRVKNVTEYRRARKKDPRLPFHPNKVYQKKWKGWDAFFGGGRFCTFDEARQIVLALGFVSSKEYKRNYKMNPRLPSEPRDTYKAHWVNWNHFLGKE